jgi:hypothetical protein
VASMTLSGTSRSDLSVSVYGRTDGMISWDIRGVNDTKPNIRCFESQDKADSFWNQSLWYKGVSWSFSAPKLVSHMYTSKVETNSSLQSPFDLAQFYSHVDSEDIRLQALWKHCSVLSGDILPYVVRPFLMLFLFVTY